MLIRFFLAVVLSALGVLAQLNTLSILQILNSSQLSPAYTFIQFLESSPDYQPMIDLLSQPGNLTFFVPSDEVLAKLPLPTSAPSQTSMGSGSNPTASASGGTGVSSMTSASDMVSALPMPSGSVSQRGLAAIAKIGPELVLDYVGVTPQRQNVAGPNRVLQAESNSPVISDGAQQYSVMDLIRYHLLNNTYMLPQDLQNNVTAVNTLLTNQTVDPLGQGIPLLINVYGNSSMNCTVGNGLGEANLTTGGIVASNGVIYVINKVLVPPGPPSQVVSQIPDLAGVNFLLQGNESLASQIDNATNVTIFAPINEALRNMNFQSMDNETFQALIFTHIVEGVYYTTNFTSTNSTGGNSTNTTNNSTASAGSSGPATATEIGMTVVANLLPFPRRQDGPMTGNNGTTGSTNSTGGNNASTVTTLAGSTLTIQPINETSFMVGNATVVRPNILLQNGVLHLIDGVLEPTLNNTQPEQNNTQPTQNITQPTQSATETNTGPFPTMTIPLSGAGRGTSQIIYCSIPILLTVFALRF